MEEILDKFNKKFHGACSRFHFWNALAEHFIDFHGLLQPNSYLTSEDKLILREIHSLLFQCYKLAKGRKEFHLGCINSLINQERGKNNVC